MHHVCEPIIINVLLHVEVLSIFSDHSFDWTIGFVMSLNPFDVEYFEASYGLV